MKRLAIALLLLTTPAHAEIVKDSSIKKPLAGQNAAITEDMVRKYYDDQISNLKAPYGDYLEYVKKAYSDKLVSKRTITIAIQGQPEQIQELTQGKADLLNIDRSTQEIGRTATVKFTIDKIDIDDKNNTARVAGRNAIEIDVDREDGQKVSANTASDCTDTLALEQGRLQMTETVCVTRTELKPRQ